MTGSPQPHPAGTAAGGPPRRRARFAGWSLRSRLTAMVVVLIAIVCVAAGVATEVALRSYLFAQLDGQVDQAARHSVVIQRGPEPPDVQPGHRQPQRFLGLPAGTVLATVEGGAVTDGQLVETHSVGGLPTEAGQQLAQVPADGQPRSVDLGGDLGTYRLVGLPVGNGETVVAGLPQGSVDATLLRVALIELLIASGAVLIGGTVGALVVRHSLRPLRRVAATASQVAELPLERGEVALSVRVPDADLQPTTEVGQVAGALNRMLQHVANALSVRHASEQRVRQFVADASHELRTPLAAIRGYAELTRRGGHHLPPDVRHAMDRVESESARMSTLVDDLLLLARLDSGRPLAHEEVDLSRLIADAVSDAHVAGPQHHWQLDLPAEPVLVTGDAARLHQVVVNLLGNARTHTPPDTTVTARLRGDRRVAVLSVRDDGPGIAPELLPRVFERFARGDSSRSRSAGSTGLGLAIVSAVVAAHHGTVGVTSPPTTFTVRLPTTPPPSASSDPPVPAAAPAPRAALPARPADRSGGTPQQQ
ncbi:two-component sensor histidine kinase [Actinocatenispora thailandica]|uniref:histidine kinase n=2 Tax=Actinocatenispora thailandica TaxID=227318 RepID=A0A7R7HYV0_9ACTN|nr:two-component sensor histidine kinase [Actinocatenispora thailandica]